MIYTVTLNPALDIEYQISEFEFDCVNRATEYRTDCGGKGFNVSRMLNNLGSYSIAMGFVGGFTGMQMEKQLIDAGVRFDFTRIKAETRINVSIVAEKSARHIKVNGKGSPITEENAVAILEAVAAKAKAGDWWVLGGSLPPGVKSDIYARIIEITRGVGGFTVLDTSGEALALGIKARPTMIKPNLEEAQQLLEDVGGKTMSQWDLADRVLAMGIPCLVISMGREGALLATHDTFCLFDSPTIVEKNPTGAGDSLVAGMVYRLSEGDSFSDALKFGIACGAATASCPGTELGSKTLVEALRQSME